MNNIIDTAVFSDICDDEKSDYHINNNTCIHLDDSFVWGFRQWLSI